MPEPIPFTPKEREIVSLYRQRISDAEVALRSICAGIISRAGDAGLNYELSEDGLYPRLEPEK